MVFKKFNKPELILAILTVIAIFLFYLLFNFNYLSTWIDEKGDAKTYEYYVRLGIPKFLYNPHHIAFDWLGQSFYKICKNNGYTGSAMTVLQLRNLIISSMGLGLLFLFLYKFSKKYFLSLIIVAAIAFSCAYWIYSQINDTPIIHSVLLALLFFFTIYFPQAKNKYLYSIFLGTFHAVTIFFHQTDILFFLVITFVILLGNNFKFKNDMKLPSDSFSFFENNSVNIASQNSFKIYNLRYFFIYAFSALTIVVIAYYYVGVVLIGLTLDPSKADSFNEIKESTYFFNWLVLYTKIDYWGKGYEGNTLQKIMHGITTYFYQPQTINGNQVEFNFSNFFSTNAILPNTIYTFLLSIFSLSIILIKPLYKKYKYIFIANIIFLITYFMFAGWWEPDYREFWVAPMFAFWFLSFFVINYLLDKFKFAKPVPQLLIYSFISTLVILLFYFNFLGFLYPNASTDYKKFDIVKNQNSSYKKINN